MKNPSLVVDHLLFHFCWNRSELVLLVSQLRLKAGFTNGLLYSSAGEPMWGARSTYYVFFNHNAAKVVRPSMQTGLRSLFSHCKPRSLNVGDIRQHHSAERYHSNVLLWRT